MVGFEVCGWDGFVFVVVKGNGDGDGESDEVDCGVACGVAWVGMTRVWMWMGVHMGEMGRRRKKRVVYDGQRTTVCYRLVSRCVARP